MVADKRPPYGSRMIIMAGATGITLPGPMETPVCAVHNRP